MQANDSGTPWFRQHFGKDYRIIYQGRDQRQADLEAEAVIHVLGIDAGDRVLDLCCGHGRHLSAFARHGIQAVGVDLSRALLLQVPMRPGRQVVCADMRALPFLGGLHGFSVVVNFFTSFGYFDSDRENLQAAHEIARVLRPGGRFALDLMNADTAISTLAPRTERRAGPFHILETRTYDSTRRRIEKQIELLHVHHGTTQHYRESVRVFTPEEIARLLDEAGLRTEKMLGNFSGGPYNPGSERMIVVGKVRTQ